MKYLSKRSGMPKTNPPANRIEEFVLGPDFQTRFDEWRLQVEKDGPLEIVHQEVIQQDTKLLITWRVVPRLAGQGSLSLDFVCKTLGVNPAELSQVLRDLAREGANRENGDEPK